MVGCSAANHHYTACACVRATVCARARGRACARACTSACLRVCLSVITLRVLAHVPRCASPLGFLSPILNTDHLPLMTTSSLKPAFLSLYRMQDLGITAVLAYVWHVWHVWQRLAQQGRGFAPFARLGRLVQNSPGSILTVPRPAPTAPSLGPEAELGTYLSNPVRAGAGTPRRQ